MIGNRIAPQHSKSTAKTILKYTFLLRIKLKNIMYIVMSKNPVNLPIFICKEEITQQLLS